MAEANAAYHKRDLYSDVTARILAELEIGDIAECPLMTAGSTGHCNTACSLSAGVSKPKVFRGR